MEFKIEGEIRDTNKFEYYLFSFQELNSGNYQMKIFIFDTLPSILTYEDSLISNCIIYAKAYYNGSIKFHWQTIRYLNEQPITIRDLVETHKYKLA